MDRFVLNYIRNYLAALTNIYLKNDSNLMIGAMLLVVEEASSSSMIVSLINTGTNLLS